MSFKETEVERIPVEWEIDTMENALEEIIDYRGKTPKKSEAGIETLSAKSVKNGYIDYSKAYFISEETYEKFMVRGFPKKGDILLTTEAPLGLVAKLDRDRVGIAQRLLTLRGKEKYLLNDYLMYYLMSFEGQHQLTSRETGTTVKGIKQKEFRKCLISLPPYEEQKSIAHILSTLDEKIEVNNQINKTLENMAQAIFKHWFVDFEFPCLPENYKFSRAGKPDDFEKVCTYKRVGGLPIPDGESWFVYVLLCEDGSFYKGMTNDLYKRFYEHYTGNGAKWTKTHKPLKVIHYEKFNTQEDARKREEELKTGIGREWIKREYKKHKTGSSAHQTCLMMAGEMVESELGMIPKGWEVKELDEVIEFQNGYAFKSKDLLEQEQGDCYHVFKMGHIIKGGGLNKAGTKSFISKKDCSTLERYLIKKGDLLMCMTDMKSNVALLGHTALMDEDDKYILNQRVGLLRTINPFTINYPYLYILSNSKDFIENLRSRANSGVQVNLSTKEIKETLIIVPSKYIHKKYNDITEKLFEKCFNIAKENDVLKNARDVLLPKLMSGKIRVPLGEAGDVS